MQAVAANVGDAVVYKGAALEGDQLDLVEDVPNAGCDVRDELVYLCLKRWQVHVLVSAAAGIGTASDERDVRTRGDDI